MTGTVTMSLEKPLTRKEIEELDKLLSSQKLFDRMVERAIKARQIERRRSETTMITRRIG